MPCRKMINSPILRRFMQTVPATVSRIFMQATVRRFCRAVPLTESWWHSRKPTFQTVRIFSGCGRTGWKNWDFPHRKRSMMWNILHWRLQRRIRQTRRRVTLALQSAQLCTAARVFPRNTAWILFLPHLMHIREDGWRMRKECRFMVPFSPM